MRHVLHSLATRQPVQTRMALIVAHPDDETIAAGASLRLMPGLLLVHVTDGAPRRLDDARRLGFGNAAAYAAARAAEVDAALAVAGVSPLRVSLGIADQDAAPAMHGVADMLHRLLAQHGTELVLTHAYEGGHPDHDATAFASHNAAARLGLPVLEFPSYHAAPEGGTVMHRFLPGPAETLVRLDPVEAERKQAMFDCFQTQRDVLAGFDTVLERFRDAPEYDFAQPPHAGRLNYENWGWELTGERWRQLAADRTACAA